MLIESGEKQHYCYVKRVSALLYDQSKSHNTKHFCILSFRFFERGFAEKPQKILQRSERQTDKD